VQKTLQEIVDFIGGTRRELLAAAHGLTPQQLDYQPGPNRWSIGQLLEHVAATEARTGQTMGQVAAQALERGLPSRGADAVDLAVFVELRTRVAGVRFQAPPEVVPSGGLGLSELVARLEAARKRLLDLVPLLAFLIPCWETTSTSTSGFFSWEGMKRGTVGRLRASNRRQDSPGLIFAESSPPV